MIYTPEYLREAIEKIGAEHKYPIVVGMIGGILRDCKTDKQRVEAIHALLDELEKMRKEE